MSRLLRVLPSLSMMLLLVQSTRPAAAFRTNSEPAQGPREVSYHLLAEEASDPTFVAVVEDAFAAWNEVSCSGLRFVFGGTVDEPDYGLNLVFTPRDNDEYKKYCGHPLASVSSGCASGDTSSFTIVLKAAALQSLKHTLAHEIGHVIGLGHASRGSSVMYYSSGQRGLPLSADDERGLCYLFPLEGEGRCQSDLDCPYAEGPTTCVSGHCEPGPTGSGGECEQDGDCRDGGCFFTAGVSISGGADYKWIDGVCGHRCETRGDCPGDDLCDYERGLCIAGQQCFTDGDCLFISDAICIPTSPRRGTNRCAIPCSSSSDCALGADCQLAEWSEQRVCTSRSGGCSIVNEQPWPAIWIIPLLIIARRKNPLEPPRHEKLSQIDIHR